MGAHWTLTCSCQSLLGFVLTSLSYALTYGRHHHLHRPCHASAAPAQFPDATGAWPVAVQQLPVGVKQTSWYMEGLLEAQEARTGQRKEQ